MTDPTHEQSSAIINMETKKLLNPLKKSYQQCNAGFIHWSLPTSKHSQERDELQPHAVSVYLLYCMLYEAKGSQLLGHSNVFLI